MFYCFLKHTTTGKKRRQSASISQTLFTFLCLLCLGMSRRSPFQWMSSSLASTTSQTNFCPVRSWSRNITKCLHLQITQPLDLIWSKSVKPRIFTRDVLGKSLNQESILSHGLSAPSYSCSLVVWGYPCSLLPIRAIGKSSHYRHGASTASEIVHSRPRPCQNKGPISTPLPLINLLGSPRVI